MSSKESELLQIFRELMSCDLHVPDHYFDRQMLEDRKAKKVAQDSYTIPLNVFWRPVELGGEDYEPNLAHPSFQKKVNAMPKLTRANYGQYLAAPLRDELRRTSLAKME